MGKIFILGAATSMLLSSAALAASSVPDGTEMPNMIPFIVMAYGAVATVILVGFVIATYARRWLRIDARRVAPLVLAFLALLVLHGGSALAQVAGTPGATNSGINVGGFWSALQPYVVEGIGIVLSALMAWVAVIVKSKFGVDISADMRDRVHSAAMTGVTAALNRIGATVGTLNVSTKNTVVDEAINWISTSVPDAVQKLGLTPDKLRTVVESKLSLLEHNAVATTVPATAAPVTK